jgi:hypothetical protein
VSQGEGCFPSQEFAAGKLINHQDAVMHFVRPVVFRNERNVMPLIVSENGSLLLDGEGYLFPVVQATSGYFINVDNVKTLFSQSGCQTKPYVLVNE